jgi:hypothetical protein
VANVGYYLEMPNRYPKYGCERRGCFNARKHHQTSRKGSVITYRLRRNNKPGKGRVKQAGYYVILVTNDDGNEQIVFYDELLSVEPKEVAIDEQH